MWQEWLERILARENSAAMPVHAPAPAAAAPDEPHASCETCDAAEALEPAHS